MARRKVEDAAEHARMIAHKPHFRMQTYDRHWTEHFPEVPWIVTITTLGTALGKIVTYSTHGIDYEIRPGLRASQVYELRITEHNHVNNSVGDN